MEYFLYLLGASLGPMGIGLFLTAWVAGRAALTPLRTRMIGLAGIALISFGFAAIQLVVAALPSYMPYVGLVVWGLILRKVFAPDQPRQSLL